MTDHALQTAQNVVSMLAQISRIGKDVQSMLKSDGRPSNGETVTPEVFAPRAVKEAALDPQELRRLGQAVMTLYGSTKATSPLGSVQAVVTAAKDLHQTVEVEATRRAEVEAWRQSTLSGLAASRAALTQYLDRTFDERGDVIERLFVSFDRAQSDGDLASMQLALSGILDVVRSSPFRNLAEFNRKFDDPEFLLEL